MENNFSIYPFLYTRGDGTPYFLQRADGGYPIAYYDKDMEFLCADCATKSLWNEYFDIPVYADVFYEGSPQECICGKIIESAYGDPEENEEK